MPKLFSDVWLLPWSAVMIVVGLGAGWLTARVCTRAVSDAAETEREQLLEDIRQRMITVAREMVVDPADRELAELDRFRAALRVAAGDGFVR